MNLKDFFERSFPRLFRKAESSALALNDQSPQYLQKRRHERFIINDPDLCTLEHHRFGLFRVVDISYYGVFLEAVGDASFAACQPPIIVDLTICGESTKFEVSDCQRRKNGWGIVFKHISDESLQKISNIINPIRCGSTAIALSDRQSISPPVKNRMRFQGDGPFDLIVEQNGKGEPAFIMATLRQGSTYGSVIWDQGKLNTKKSIDIIGDAARMSQTPEVDANLVWSCALACLGMKSTQGQQCARVLGHWHYRFLGTQ